MVLGLKQRSVAVAIPLRAEFRNFCNLFPCALCGCERACDVIGWENSAVDFYSI